MTGRAVAGGGPEGVVLVVNANSPSSLEIANHYARLRGLSATNVIHLDYQGDLQAVTGEVFREQILKPVLEQINQRGLALQTDTITYSSDFPWQVRLYGEFAEDAPIPKVNKPVASLTGATYLWQLTLGKNPAALNLSSNWYVPGANERNLQKCQDLGEFTSQGFRGRYAWRPGGERAKEPSKGLRYLMSTMLGVTTGRGNTVEEVVESLKRSVYAELSPPTGEFFFTKNQDIRSKTRDACYEQAAQMLRGLGAKARVLEGALPSSTSPALGVMTGAAKLDFGGTELPIAQGAICEHLTSSGGNLRTLAGQTPISAWIRAGASGTSGTVDEPYAIQAKFPLPTLQVHYRRGCSLAEAFYQSVQSPYQLLILGDPLCQPWANRPVLTAPGWPGSDELSVPATAVKLTPPKGSLEITLPNDDQEPTSTADADLQDESESPADESEEDYLFRFTPAVKPTAGKGALFWELFVDGKLRMRLPSGSALRVSEEDLGPGWHELRCVASNPDPIEARQQINATVEIDRTGPEGQDLGQVLLEAARLSLDEDQPAVMRCSAPAAERIEIYQHARKVAEVTGDSGEFTIDPKILGKGPVRLHAVSLPDGARSKPAWFIVD